MIQLSVNGALLLFYSVSEATLCIMVQFLIYIQRWLTDVPEQILL